MWLYTILMFKKQPSSQDGIVHIAGIALVVVVAAFAAFVGYGVYKKNSIFGVLAQTACPKAPTAVSPQWYLYTNKYNSACASKQNWGKTYQDQTITAKDGTNTISVTTSTSLAGAIASIKVNDHEFVQSGGHGAASQWNITRWGAGENASECWNPTQAGSTTDDRGKTTPYHGPSSSSLFSMQKTSSSSIESSSRLAYFVPFGEVSAYDGCTRPKTGTSDDTLSPWWLKNTTRLSPYGLNNVVEVEAQFSTSESAPTNNPLNLKFVHTTYLLNSHKNIAQDKTPMAPGVGGTVRNKPAILCDDAGYCLAEWIPKPSTRFSCNYWRETIEGNPKSDAYNGYGGSYVAMTSCVAKSDAANYVPIKAGEQITQKVYIVIGSKQRILDTMALLETKVK